MKHILKQLPVLGLVLGATLALAFNTANQLPQQVYAIDPDDEEFINVTSLVLGEDYTCDGTGDCLFDAPEGNAVRPGTFAWKE